MSLENCEILIDLNTPWILRAFGEFLTELTNVLASLIWVQTSVLSNVAHDLLVAAHSWLDSSHLAELRNQVDWLLGLSFSRD